MPKCVAPPVSSSPNPIRSSGKPIRRCARRWPTQVKAKSTLSSDSFGLSSSQGGEVEPIVGSWTEVLSGKPVVGEALIWGEMRTNPTPAPAPVPAKATLVHRSPHRLSASFFSLYSYSPLSAHCWPSSCMITLTLFLLGEDLQNPSHGIFSWGVWNIVSSTSYSSFPSIEILSTWTYKFDARSHVSGFLSLLLANRFMNCPPKDLKGWAHICDSHVIWAWLLVPVF